MNRKIIAATVIFGGLVVAFPPAPNSQDRVGSKFVLLAEQVSDVAGDHSSHEPVGGESTGCLNNSAARSNSSAGAIQISTPDL
jgi:hypothetical protein